MGQKFSDAARSKLASGAASGDTTLALLDGSAFPVADTGAFAISDAADWFKLVLSGPEGLEIVYVRTHGLGSASFSDVLRGQDGTAATDFPAGTAVGLRPLASDAAAWSAKQDAEAGMGLSQEDFTTAEKVKLAGIAAGAQANVQSDWNAASGDAQILNKPPLGTAAAKDVPASGDAAAGEVVLGSDSRLFTDAAADGKQYARKDNAWVEVAGSGAATGDIVTSLDRAGHALPDWLKCDGSAVATADTPVSLRPFLVAACDPVFTEDLKSPDSMAAAPQSVLAFNDDWALVQFSASPFVKVFNKVSSGSYSYELRSYGAGATPTAAIKCATLTPSADGILMFTASAGGVIFDKLIGGTVSSGSPSSDFSGLVVVGCAYGLDGRWYFLSTTAPYLYSVASPDTSSRRDEGGCGASPVGLRMSPNGKYMVSWHSAAPYVFVWEFDGGRYQPLGSPVSGAASFVRMEISDTGVFLGKPSTGSVFYVGHTQSDGSVSIMTANTVNAATAWGLMPDGRAMVDWVSSVASYRPIVGDVVGSASSLAIYRSAAYATLYDRPGITSAGQLLWGSSSSSFGYAMVGKATPSGYMAPNVHNGYLKA